MPKIICFHNADEPNGYLSNWYLSDFVVDGHKFSSVEQYMMYQKAALFGDHPTASEILSTDNVGRIKALGRSVQNYDDTVWNGVRQIIVYRGLLEKFRQNEDLKRQLLATAPHTLAECAECAVQYKIWGIGLSMRDEYRLDPDLWQGQNLLGFTLMQVRTELRKKKGTPR